MTGRASASVIRRAGASMTPRRAIQAATLVVGVGLFVRSLQILGFDRIKNGMVHVGWGFVAIVILAGAREAARTLAWMRTVEGPVRLGFAHAFRARLAGEALNTLLPMGILVGEPAKAVGVGRQLPFSTAFTALVVEFAFYCGSLVPLLGAGGIVMLATAAPAARFGPAAGAGFVAAWALLAAATVLAAAFWMRSRGYSTPRLRGLLNAVSGFAARHPERLWPIIGFEAAFQLLAVAEVYITLMCINSSRPTLASAVAFEAISRAITMAFKMLPLRIGVDEAGASMLAGSVDLATTTGITLALVRKVRLLIWSGVGLLLLIGRSSDRSIVDSASGSVAGPLLIQTRTRSI